MKPISMTISAFGPYADQVEIPFDALGEQGVFLITGDTGAGKTTLFDALCFALFGEVSGSNREVDGLRSDFAKPEIETFVQLDFLHHGQTYHIWRKPAYMRMKKRGDGVIKENADATFTNADGTVVTGARKATQAIEQLLGVDDRQFKQIAMIAQGEFLKLLYADSKERGDIFRRVFHTDLYRRFQDKLKELEKEKKADYEDAGSRLILYLGQCGIEEDTQTMLYHVPELLEQLKIQIEEQEKKCLTLERRLEAQENIVQQQHIHLEKAKQDNERIQLLEDAKQKYEALQTMYQQRSIERNTLEQQRRAVDYVQPTEQVWQKEKQQTEDFEKRLQALLQLQEKQKKQLEEETQEKERTKPLIEDVQREKAQMLQMQKQLQEYEQRDHIASQVAQKEKELLALQNERKENISFATKKEKELETLKEQEGQLPVLEQKYQVLEQQLQQNKKRIEDIVQAEQKEQMRLRKEKELQALRIQYKAQSKKWNMAKYEADQAERQYLLEQAGVLAEHLTEGMPCPVCGSVHHPQKAVLSDTAPTEKECNDLRNQEAKEKQKLESIGAEGQQVGGIYQQMQKEQEEFLQRLGVSYVTELMEEKQQLQQQAEQWGKEQQAIRLQQQKMKEIPKQRMMLEKSLQVCQKKQEQLEENIENYRKKKDILSGEHQALCQRLGDGTLQDAKEALQAVEDQMMQKEKQLQSIETAWQEAKENLTKIESKVSQLKEHLKIQKENMKQAEKHFDQVLQEQGFSDRPSYTAFLRTRTELERAEKENQDYFHTLQQNTVLLQSREKDALGKEKQDLKKLQEELETWKAEKFTLQKQKEIEYSQLDARKNAFSQSQKYWEVRQQAEKVYLPILELSRTANGQQSVQGDKMTFEVFLQSFYFDHIVEAANLRFEKMTSGRFHLRRMETASDKRSQMGLELEVVDFFTGKARGVKSLSGGEAFQASLSLALGLSDMIQQTAGGIEIQSMFIDEGFGALDERSREQAVQILQELAYGNRIVGIISHVTELKESIEKKVVIEKCNTGSKVSFSF